jgi:hypothetical protein
LQARGCSLLPYNSAAVANWQANTPQQLVSSLRVLDVGENVQLAVADASAFFSALKLWEL